MEALLIHYQISHTIQQSVLSYFQLTVNYTYMQQEVDAVLDIIFTPPIDNSVSPDVCVVAVLNAVCNVLVAKMRVCNLPCLAHFKNLINMSCMFGITDTAVLTHL